MQGRLVMLNTPLYRHVYDQIKQRISAGVYPRGSALPSEIKLSQEFGVSQITVRRAIHELALDGLVDRRQGIGTIVRDSARSVLIGLSSFTSDVAAGRLRLVRTLVTDETITASDGIAGKLALQPGSLVRHLTRLDTEGDIPISVDDAYTPAALSSVITPDVAASLLFLDLWQARSGIVATSTDCELAAEMPNRALQALMQVGPDVPILFVGEVIRDGAGRALHYIISRYRSDRVRLSTTGQVLPRESSNGLNREAAVT
jgi:DNA-binding GntR family transcriptional regulator